MQGSDKPGTYENLLTVTAQNTNAAENPPTVTAQNPTSNDFEFVIPRKTDRQMDHRQIVRAGITKNHGNGTAKSKRRMVSASRKRNRSK